MKKPFLILLCLFGAACSAGDDVSTGGPLRIGRADFSTVSDSDEDVSPPSEETPPIDEEPPVEEGPTQSPPPHARASYADRIVSHATGAGGGANENQLSRVVLGPPHGAGAFQGSQDVFSLGVRGQIILEMTDYLIFDGEGPDFIVFENAFQVGTFVFMEPGIVSVSEDGVHFVEFSCSQHSPYIGCAGTRPVLANPDLNDLDPTDSETAGGDAFDLADVGLEVARFVKVRDAGLNLGPSGNKTSGFDLDAVAIINGTLP